MKRILTLVLVLMLVLTLGALTACKEDQPDDLDPTSLSITSAKEVTLELGQSYTLTYDTDGTVNVSVSGGSYNEETQKFTATEAGTYTITVTATAEGKSEVSETVTVIFTVASADKTALSASIDSTKSLVKSDYTSDSWKKLEDALNAGKSALNQSGISQEDVDAAKAAIDGAVNDLVSNLVKASIAEDEASFEWNGNIYSAIDYNNFADIVAELKTLNADADIDLKSEYNPAIKVIIEKLAAKVKLAIKSELKDNAMMIVESLVSYDLVAESEDGVTYSWKVDGSEVSTEATYKFAPSEYKEYEIQCTVAKGDNVNVKSLTVAFIESDYFVNTNYVADDRVTVKDNKISVNANLGWGEEEGKKVTLPDLRLSGDFTVYFDVEFLTHEDTGVMALFLNKENGERNDFWVAVLQHSNKLEIATSGADDDHKPRYDMPQGTADLNKVIHVKMTRTVKDGKAYLYAYILDDSGKVIMEHDANKLYKDDDASKGTVQIGIQAENAHFIVSNLAVGINDQIISKTGLNKALSATNALIEGDYTADSWKALVDAKATASAAVNQSEINAVQAAVVKATSELVIADIAKAVIENGNISFDGKSYLSANFENMSEVIAELEELNADASIKLNSVYAPKAQAIINKLISKVTLEISGAPENNVQYLVSTLPTYAMNATSSEGASVVWSVNGEEVSNDAEYEFTPDKFGAYTISCVATKGEYSSEKEYSVVFVNAGWTSNKPGASIDNNAIKITENYGWDDLKGKKVTTSDITLSGNFTVSFDLTFNNQNGVNVFALFLLKANGDVNNDWVAITSQNNKLEVSCLEQKAYKDLSEGATSINVKSSYIVSREIIDGRAYITAYYVNANGERVVTNDGTQDGGNRVSSDYVGPVVLGIQSENAHFVVENIRLNASASVNSKVELRALVASTSKIVKTDYIESVVSALNAKIDAANAVLANVDAEQSAINTAIAELGAALLDLKPENYVEVTKAVVTDDSISYSITGLTLNKADLYNFDAIATVINTLNGSDEYAANSVYTAALTEALKSADYKIGLSEINWAGLVNDIDYITSMNPEYSLSVSSKTKDIEIAWSVNGEKVGDDVSYILKPESGKSYSISVVLQKKGEGYEDEKVTFSLENVSFIKADVKTPLGDRVSINEDASFSTNQGIGWGDMEGRNILFDDLVFNGSFSITMDLTYNGTSGGATVATIHLLNADTLSPSWGGDWAFVGYGCICLHTNPDEPVVRLESNWTGTEKKQSSYDGFEAVEEKIAAVADQLKQGETFTVKLTCYRNSGRQLQLVYSLYDSKNGEWIDFNRNQWAGDMGGGFIVGINVENVAITGKNIRYELLAETDDHIAGVVNSRASLSAALVKYQDIVASDYVNGQAFVSAYNAGWALMSNNQASVDYEAAAKAIVDAAEALVKREVAVSVEQLDKGYTFLKGVSELKAVFAEGVDATNIKWSYKLNDADVKESEGNIMSLEDGDYKEVKLSFNVGDQSYVYHYQDFNCSVGISLKSNNGEVTISDGVVTVDNGAGWNAKEQLVIENVNSNDFELTFNAKYLGTPGGGFQVMCINLFGEDLRPVFGYQREERGNRAQLGFDNNGQWEDINNTDAEDDAYDYIFSQAVKFGLKVYHDAEGKIYATFSVYAADGSVIASKTCDWTRWYSSKTALRFTFENIDLELSDFVVYHN